MNFIMFVAMAQDAPIRLITSDADAAKTTTALPAWATEGWGPWAIGGVAVCIVLLAAATAGRMVRAKPLAERAFVELARRLRLNKHERAFLSNAVASDARTMGNPAGVLLCPSALSRALQTQIDVSAGEDQLKRVAGLYAKLTPAPLAASFTRTA